MKGREEKEDTGFLWVMLEPCHSNCLGWQIRSDGFALSLGRSTALATGIFVCLGFSGPGGEEARGRGSWAAS